ncbi:uncharacterized protein LOC134821797 isoform X3 [Bolinopsis microptera]|uniref:uncharacterized protein LOC134821797 isoform X3 n=1 Tax=Bolinopsis microptera TaxID=2820187 RepID=UPI003078AFAD
MVDILMIKADDPKVLSQYHKQKLEFHFQQKSDNDFVRFLLDTAVRVISIVQHLAPVLEAVSTAGSEQTDQNVSNHYISDFNLDSVMNMEIETPKRMNITPSNTSEETSNLDVESLTNNSIAPSPAFNVNSLGSALKSFAPPTSAFQTALSSATPVQALNNGYTIASSQSHHSSLNASLNNMSASSSPILQNVPVAFSSPVPKVDPIQLEAASSFLEFDKTISALQKELDSVSQSLVSESDKGPTPPPTAFDPSNLNNLAIIKRLQENFKDTSDLTPQSGKELDLIKTIQETIANRAKTEDVVKIKEEMEVMPSLAIFRDSDTRQTTDRLQQLMSSLNNTSPQTTATSAAAPCFTPPGAGLHQVPNSTALTQITSLAPTTMTTGVSLSQLTSGVASPGPSLSPGLKSAQKKNGNPLSMLHLQGNGGVVDQAAILSVLYNDRNPNQASPDNMKLKSAARSSPNSSPTSGRRRPFHCVHCLKNFSFKSSLDRHISVIHLGLRRYSCPICAAAFGQKKQLKHHMSTRHSDVLAQLQMIQTS